MGIFKKKRMVHEIKYNNGHPIKNYKHYSVDEKIDYYSNRINDNSLTDNQRKFAKKKVSMLISGVGRIYLITDDQFGNQEYGSDFKIRRVVPTAINENNKNVLINGIYSRTNYFRNLKLNNYDDEGFIPILNHESYLDIQPKKKIDGTYFNLSDLEETTSTLNPFELDSVIDYVYPKNANSRITRYNKHLYKKLRE